jgi:hypothetical protein
VDLLSFPCNVLTLKFQWELEGLELDLVTRLTDIALMATAIRATDTGIIHMDTTSHIRPTAITRVPRTTGPVDAGFITATTVIITTVTGTKLT